MSDGDDQARIRDQIEFYRAQARHAPADGDDPQVRELLSAYFDDPELRQIVLTHCRPSVRCLELGSGPGRWTGPLLDVCQQVTAIDTSAELHALSRSRHGGDRVEYVVADIFEYQPDAHYDLIFAGYWLSHVPASRFQPFWSMVRDALAPGGHAVMVDDGILDAEGTEQFADDPTGGGEQRRLADGREFTIVKVACGAPRPRGPLGCDRLGRDRECAPTRDLRAPRPAKPFDEEGAVGVGTGWACWRTGDVVRVPGLVPQRCRTQGRGSRPRRSVTGDDGERAVATLV